MDKKLLMFTYSLLIFSIIIFGECLINFSNYSSSYILFLLFFILLALLVYIVGILINKKKIYNDNIKLYIILYVILLISLTVFINRPDFALFDAKYFELYLANINLIPFKTIIHFLTGNINMGVRIYNILGNFVALMPLSLLLILFNKRYDSYKKQLKVLFITVLIIEFMQFILAAGRLDIDDFILNIGGALIFFTIIKKANLVEKIRNLFNSDMGINIVTKYIILGVTSLAIIIMNIIFIVDLSIGDIKHKEGHDYFSAYQIEEKCNGLRKVEFDEYDLFINCVDISFTNEDDYYFTLEEAIKDEQIDLDNLNEYFKIVEFLENVTIYHDDEFTLFKCNTSNDIYVGNKDMEYDGECE